ncbi:MAG: trehalose-phosphatase [Acidobacteriia bacterium]|nr:trehalose-phosphatase [Terriglobia bacterium]
MFVDFDGTLARLRSRPDDVTVPLGVKRVLQRLARNANIFIAIVSGRRRQNLRDLIGVERVHYFGLHGAERDGEQATVSRESALALESAKRAVRRELGPFPGIWIEDKGLAFSVHHRDAHAAESQSAGAALVTLLAPWKDALHVLDGSRVWEILPKEIPGKHAAVGRVLGGLPAGTSVVYAGDDGTDEPAFAMLPDQITIRVGYTRNTRTGAQFCLPSPAYVLRFLTRLERELR